jgi:hypothetical protein
MENVGSIMLAVSTILLVALPLSKWPAVGAPGTKSVTSMLPSAPDTLMLGMTMQQIVRTDAIV